MELKVFRKGGEQAAPPILRGRLSAAAAAEEATPIVATGARDVNVVEEQGAGTDGGGDEIVHGIRMGTMVPSSWEEGGRDAEEEDGGRGEESAVPLMSDGSPAGRNEVPAGSSPGAKFTVEDAINSIGFGKFQVGMVLYAGLMWLADAGEMTLLSFIGGSALCEWRLSSVEEESLSSVVFIGILFGAYCWGILSDLNGRRFAFLTTAFFTTVFGLLSAWSPTFLFLVLSRTLVGFGLGGASVGFSLCMEFLPENGRGFWLVLLEVFWSAGSIVQALLAWIILPNYNWRWLVGVSALPFIVLLACYPILPESPRYLMMKGDSEGAMKVLRRVANANGKALPHGVLTWVPDSDDLESTLKDTTKSDLPLRGSVKTLLVDMGGAKQLALAFDTFKHLFSPKLLRTTLLLWFLFFANAFIYYGLVLLTTELQLNNEEGRVCSVSSTDKLYATRCHPDGLPVINASQFKSVLITCIAELPGLFVACLTVEKLGRKISIAGLLIGCGLFLLPLTTATSQMTTTVLMFGARSCIMGAFSVLWAYAPELYYTNVRTTGVGAANSAGRIGGFLCPFVAIGLIESCERTLAVGLFSAASVLAGMMTFFFPKEIKRADDFPRLVASG